jgi:hypothetical protein
MLKLGKGVREVGGHEFHSGCMNREEVFGLMGLWKLPGDTLR